jgi:hypothetical protein
MHCKLELFYYVLSEAIHKSSSFNGRRSSAQTVEREVRVPMQKLQMTSENQDMVEDMLKDLRGEEFDIYR